MDRLFFTVGALFAFLGVAAGALGTHGLKGHLDRVALDTFEIAVRYQMYHALGLFGIAWASTRWPTRLIRLSGLLFILGTVSFSGSLYLLSLMGIEHVSPLAPIGGLLLLIGWGCLIGVGIGSLRNQSAA